MELRKVCRLETPTLIIREVKVQHIHAQRCHAVDDSLQGFKWHEMARHINQHTSPWEPRGIGTCYDRQSCSVVAVAGSEYELSHRFEPLHHTNSTFALDGSITTENSPSPRGMDTMDTKVEEGTVWIRFQQFRPNVPEKIPL